MHAVLITRSLNEDDDGKDLEIAIVIEQIPPIGFEYNFYIPHKDGVEGRLALVVTGWNQCMKRTHEKRFSGEPIMIQTKLSHNSECGLNYEEAKKHLDRRTHDIPKSIWESILSSPLSDLYKPLFRKLRDNGNEPMKGSELGRYGLIHSANNALKAMGIHFAIRRTEKGRKRYADTHYRLYPL